MKWTSVLAIYFLFFVATAFLMLPFGVKTDEEVGNPRIPGQAESAPHRFEPGKHLLRAALIAVVLMAIYYANYVNGWITVEDIDWLG